MPTYRAHYFEDGEERSARFSLSPGESCLLRLEAAQGSQAIYVVITEEADGRSRPRLRAEVEAEPGERVEVKVSLHPASDGGEPWLSLASENKRCLILKPDHQYSPLPPLVPRRDSRELDVAVVIDGTVRIWDEDAAQLNLLLDQRDAWLEHVVQLTALLEELMESYRDVHAAVYAFGDHLFSELGDPDLKPSYLLDPPEGHRLRVSQAEELQQRMMDLRSSPGGDFVDALGEALSVACTLAWRPNARKILILSGDSPGHSLLYPLPRTADGRVRDADVDMAAAQLHCAGVEIVSIYHDVPTDSGLREGRAGPLLRGARDQYRHLASHTGYAVQHSELDVGELVARLRNPPAWIGRGACLGALFEPPSRGR
jgi:hypothetical protein